jgi:hypothetical protein
MGAASARAAREQGFVPFPARRADEWMRLRLERSVMHPLVLSVRKCEHAAIFEHISCIGRAEDVARAMRRISDYNKPSQDCIFSLVSQDGSHVVCMWLVRRRVALSALIESAQAHPRRLFTRMRRWMDTRQPRFYVLQSRIHAFALFRIAADFGITTVTLCDNASMSTRHSYVAPRIRNLCIEMCDPAAALCEEIRELLAICDRVTAPIGCLADAGAPLRDSPWADRGIQIRIRTMCADLRRIVRRRCGSDACVRALRAASVLVDARGLRIWWSSPLSLCAACSAAVRIASAFHESY